MTNETKKVEKKITPQEIYKKLSVPIPDEFLVTYEEDGKEFTGYHAQYAIDLLNKAVGFRKWSTEEDMLKEEITKSGFLVAMKIYVKLFIGDKGIKVVTGYGAAYSKGVANAYKGAKTSAFKNACRYLGIGK